MVWPTQSPDLSLRESVRDYMTEFTQEQVLKDDRHTCKVTAQIYSKVDANTSLCVNNVRAESNTIEVTDSSDVIKQQKRNITFSCGVIIFQGSVRQSRWSNPQMWTEPDVFSNEWRPCSNLHCTELTTYLKTFKWRKPPSPLRSLSDANTAYKPSKNPILHWFRKQQQH